jgi:2-desacetyl-2-hydroxyethyl bacteriochlorophyllide A dehydrogenase
MKREVLYFAGPRQVEVRAEELPAPAAGQVSVAAVASAISAGSELLVYRGEAPRGAPVDLTIAALAGDFAFPLRYGYSMVGRVEMLGPGVEEAWRGRLVFAFQPHQSRFLAAPAELMPLPGDLSPEDAVFLPNAETAVNLVLDGRPLIGERVVVIGQGVVGLLATALLASFPLAALVTLDGYARRREASRALGATASIDPGTPDARAEVCAALAAPDADLVYELSGNPAALDVALAVCGFAGRIVVGSWYGEKRAPVDLGGAFHRGRMRLVGSQVSTLAPELEGRWTKARRMHEAMEAVRRIGPAGLVTRRFPLEAAAQAYRLLDEDPSRELQVLFTYP